MTQLSLLDRDWINLNAPLVLTAMQGRRFSSDDVYSVVPPPEDHNNISLLMAKLAASGAIRRVGSVKTAREAGNKRWIGLYETC